MSGLFDEFFEQSLDLLCIANFDGYFVELSAQWSTVLGWSKEELCSKPFVEFVHPGDRSSTNDIAAALLSGGQTIHFENRYRHRDGSYRWIAWNSIGVPEKKLIYAAARDVTSFKEMSLLLGEMQRVAKIGGWKLSVSDGVTHWTDETYRIHEIPLGTPTNLVNGISFYAPEAQPLIQKTVERCYADGTPWDLELPFITAKGRRLWVRTIGKPILDAQGKVAEIYGTFQDITEQKKNVLSLESQEARLLEAQRVAKIGSWSYSVSQQRISWTPEMYVIFGENPALGEPNFDKHRATIYEEDRALWSRTVDKVLSDGKPYSMRFRVAHSGKIVWVEARGQGLRNELGEVIKISGTCQDVTESVLSEEEHKYTLRAASLGIWKWDVLKNILLWDQSLYDLYEVDPKEFSGAYDAWEKTLHPQDKKAATEALDAALRGDCEFDTTFRILTRSSQVKYIGGRGKVVRGNDGKPLFMHGVNWDRTAEVTLAQTLDLERAKSVQAAKLATLGEMAAGVAHEINNPLAMISASAELLPQFVAMPEKHQRKVEMIQKSVERISKIVQALRKFSRTSGSKEMAPNTLSGILTESLVLTEAKAARAEVKIDCDLQSSADIICDELEIEQVLVNLINNAIDAVKALSEKWIRISTFDEGSEVVLHVIDSGHGISSEVRDKIFDPFFTTKPFGEGTGLGMSISKGIIESHGGRISVRDDQAHTCIEIRLPMTHESNSTQGEPPQQIHSKKLP